MYRVSPEEDAPTASTFLPMAGLLIVHEVLKVSPSFPAAKIKRCSGFFERGSAIWREVEGKEAASTPVSLREDEEVPTVTKE